MWWMRWGRGNSGVRSEQFVGQQHIAHVALRECHNNDIGQTSLAISIPTLSVEQVQN